MSFPFSTPLKPSFNIPQTPQKSADSPKTSLSCEPSFKASTPLTYERTASFFTADELTPVIPKSKKAQSSPKKQNDTSYLMDMMKPVSGQSMDALLNGNPPDTQKTVDKEKSSKSQITHVTSKGNTKIPKCFRSTPTSLPKGPKITSRKIDIISPGKATLPPKTPLIPKKVKTVHLKKSMGLTKKYIVYQETPGADMMIQ